MEALLHFHFHWKRPSIRRMLHYMHLFMEYQCKGYKTNSFCRRQRIPPQTKSEKQLFDSLRKQGQCAPKAKEEHRTLKNDAQPAQI